MDNHTRQKNILLFLILFILICGNVYPQTGGPAGNVASEDTVNRSVKKEWESINVDAKMLYGQYNNVDSSFSMTQNSENLAYQLSSDLKRSNDFGYSNSSFYENEMGFTVKADFSENWKFMPEMSIKNESHGMFDNPVYSREEKDKVMFALKNEYKPAPSRFEFNFSGSQYIHRLVETSTADVSRSGFNKINEEIGWEYIWSASNRFGMKHDFSVYYYDTNSHEKIRNDVHTENEVYFNFKIIEYIQISMGGIIDWNNDYRETGGWFPSGKINISTIGFKSGSMEVSYKYDLNPFQPELFYFEQKYVSPNYNLLPQKVHQVDLRGDLDIKFDGEDNFPVRMVTLRGKGSYTRNDNFYNYVPLQGEVLGAESLPAVIYRFKGDFITDLRILKKKLKLAMNYEYSLYRSDRNITYRPRDIIGSQINYRNNGLEIEWENRLIDEVYINPDPLDKRKLDRVVIGSIIMQLKMVESFFLYAKVNNLYDGRYSLRDGYFEPGRTYLGGLRIVI